MHIIERTKKQEIEYNKAKRMEKLKRNIALLKAKLFNKPISPDDPRTLQAHKDAQGNLRDYYVANPYLQEGTSFNCVTPIIEEINRYVYRGIVLGADNATGIIESNVPLEEIVASPSGNIKLQEMLSQENAVAARDRYYGKIGEPQGPLEKHSTHFGKPDFPLGTILKGEKRRIYNK